VFEDISLSLAKNLPSRLSKTSVLCSRINFSLS
jgi:hypothetical protein